ncbi:MAG TPA: squalene/phytoene synthase family protein [Planctomycetota bacterium]|nr:squalene/phytoene synthase family protein [Planctomycetota bacterium]
MNKTPPFDLCWQVLPEVSRSFALVIRCLPRGLDDGVMVSYLLCRIADTIEDSPRPVAEKRSMLAGFAAALDRGTALTPPEVEVPPTYRRLMRHVPEVLECYRTLDPAARRIIADRVREMCEGMSKWADRRIVTIPDQNEYCYYVAGLVGNLLTDLFVASGHVPARSKALLDLHSVEFGLALQKVNIIRDVRADLEEGRCYWPSELMARQGLDAGTILRPENVDRAIRVMDDLIADQWTYLRAALRYITYLPATELRVRMFCAIPLFMAVATARFCQGNGDVFLSPRAVKIPSRMVRSIIMRSMSLGSFNTYLQSWFRRWQHGAVDRPSPFQAVAALLP